MYFSVTPLLPRAAGTGVTGGGISFAGVGGGGGDKDADELADWGVDSGDETAGETTDDGVALAG